MELVLLHGISCGGSRAFTKIEQHLPLHPDVAELQKYGEGDGWRSSRP